MLSGEVEKIFRSYKYNLIGKYDANSSDSTRLLVTVGNIMILLLILSSCIWLHPY